MVLGAVELSSIAKGFEVLDVIVKVAPVNTLYARPVCPGKFLIFFTGDVASVESSVMAGRERAESFLVDYLLIPNLHREIEVFFLNEKFGLDNRLEISVGNILIEAVGLVESYTALSAIRAADTACKKSGVKLVKIKLADDIGGKSFFLITGGVESVEIAVEAAIVFEKEKGLLCKEVIIPRPHPDILDYLGRRE